MAGHSKWAQIKRKKAKVDAEKGKLFTRLAREIIVAARQGGGDPEANPRLKAAVQRAREANIPMENIQRAIMKGTGELAGANVEELTYEGYGPGGVAIMLEIMTDNRNRTAGEIRHLFSKYGGSLGEAGCVAWMFKKRGYFAVEKSAYPAGEEALLEVALEAGADDLVTEEEVYTITCDPEDFSRVKDALTAAGVPLAAAEITMLPQSTVSVTGPEAEKLERLLEALEEHDDVQEVYTNYAS